MTKTNYLLTNQTGLLYIFIEHLHLCLPWVPTLLGRILPSGDRVANRDLVSETEGGLTNSSSDQYAWTRLMLRRVNSNVAVCPNLTRPRSMLPHSMMTSGPWTGVNQTHVERAIFENRRVGVNELHQFKTCLCYVEQVSGLLRH